MVVHVFFDWKLLRILAPKGSDAYNQALPERRAGSIVNVLNNQGVGKLTAKGYGESKPVVDNKTAEGHAKNRRVELTTDGGKKMRAK